MPFSTNSSDGEVINFTLERDYEIGVLLCCYRRI